MSDGRKRGWFARRGGVGKLFGFVAEGAEEIGTNARQLRPSRFSKRGFFGQDEDGGIARFREMAEDLSAEDISAAHRRWSMERQAYLIAALSSIVLLIGSGFFGFLTIHFGIGLVIVAIFFALRYYIADFRAWQIEQGRFGPPAEYINYRLPRNMQIVEKD